MRNKEKVLFVLKDLLALNYQVEKLYTNASYHVNGAELEILFKERAIERQEYAQGLRVEMLKLGIEPQMPHSEYAGFRPIWRKFKFLLSNNQIDELLSEMFYVMQWSVNKYNLAISEPGLPLSVCKKLLKQRDAIESAHNSIKRIEHELVS
ncbi:DUF2383 domain-containing protein [Tamlana fucoidanivorans]|uniref:DUF2383 domain-containing protein n=1 Tax=Allotamlana fucoidanivorans TaxID=2583814 RepID=A0A5C4SMN0_9FLAO|nr:DUF2383 domain-containing protein [Tamlana fucoidanivorans]TNJ45329.1 DUF2383 domain-containing protein [Tamlana fucoidanivorans]